MPDLRSKLFQQMSNLPTPVTIADPYQDDMPLIFCNEAFEDLSGYTFPEVEGRNCRFLQGEHRQPDCTNQIRETLEARESLSLVLRNYRKDGSQFTNLLFIEPLRSRAGTLLFYLGCQYELPENLTVTDLDAHMTLLENVADCAGVPNALVRRTIFQSFRARSSSALTFAIIQINRTLGAIERRELQEES